MASYSICIHANSYIPTGNLGRTRGVRHAIVCKVVVLPLSASVTPVASPADFGSVDQESYVYSAYLVVQK